MRKERFLMSMVDMITKTEMSLFGTSTMVLTKDGLLDTLIPSNQIQRRVNSLKTTDSTLKDHSILSLK